MAKSVTGIDLAIVSGEENEMAKIAYDVAWFKGYEQAVDDFAIWRNGEQLVGGLESPKRQVLESKWRELFNNEDYPWVRDK